MIEWMSATMKFPLLVYSILLFIHPAVYGQTRLQMRNRTAAVKERRDGLIQEAVRSLLGVKESSSRGNPVGRRPPTPPRYMLDLYDRYRSGQVPTQGNTVRSILPMRGKLEGVDMLVFNLTGIHSEEQILQAKLHIFKRRRVKGARKRELSHLRLKVTDLTRKTAPMLVNVAREQHGWQAYEITEAVFQCREVKHDGHYLLGVTMETSRPNGKYKAIPMRRVVRLNSQPFLIIFSEDRENTTHQLASSDSQEDGEEDVVEGDGKDERDPVRSKFSRLSDDIIMSRIKRSIFTNEVPDYSLYADDIDKNYSYNFYAKAKHRKVDPNIIPSPNDLKPRKPLKRVHKAKKNRRNRKLPHWWARHKKSYHPHNDPSDLCQRKKLVVSFSHIGWGEWIISPKSFEAHYCTGMCSFPLTKDLKPSNHATIQSLVHALGLYPHVPAPCCVPDAASSLTLLYFDEDRNVVLKNYPNMIVESCACK